MKKNNKVAPADDAGDNELDSVVTKDTKNSGAIPAVIVFEDDEFYRKWSGPIILGPFTLALFSLIVIVSGEIVLSTWTGTCGYALDCK